MLPVWRVTLASIDRNPGYSEGLVIMPGGIVRRGVVSSHSDPKEPFLCADDAAVPQWVREQ